MILAILFLIYWVNMSQGYYQIVRIAGLAGFAVSAYQLNQKGQQTEMVIYGRLSLLFQPFFKIALLC
jgi:hypothetical protein